jgi:hypothetical protein
MLSRVTLGLRSDAVGKRAYVSVATEKMSSEVSATPGDRVYNPEQWDSNRVLGNFGQLSAFRVRLHMPRETRVTFQENSGEASKETKAEESTKARHTL